MVVAEYHRYDSKSESLVIQPDQSIAQRILNVRRVSIARNTMGLWKYRPACAIDAVFKWCRAVQEIKC